MHKCTQLSISAAGFCAFDALKSTRIIKLNFFKFNTYIFLFPLHFKFCKILRGATVIQTIFDYFNASYLISK